MVMVEGLATALDPEINMWDVAAPFVKDWIRDELGPEAVIVDRVREDLETLMRLPALVRRIEDRFPPKGGAPEQAPLPEVELIWERRKRESNHWGGYALAAILGGAAAWALTYWTLLH
jgi:ubiquinone biosynthesis protein